MKIVLFSSLSNSTKSYGILSFLAPKLPAVGLLSVAANLIENGYEDVEIIDYDCERRDLNQIIMDLSISPPDIIGVSIFSNLYFETSKAMGSLRRAFPDATIVVGGPHVILNGSEVMEQTVADFACTGEGEVFMLELIAFLNGAQPIEDIDGLIYRDSEGRLRKTKKREVLHVLDDLPKPAYHLIDRYLYEYQPVPIYYGSKPILALITSRGCPFRCKFCAKTLSSKWRPHSTEYLADLVKEQVERKCFKEMIIFDDTFAVDRERVISFCCELIRRKVDLRWSASVNLINIDEEVAHKMHEAGCWLIHSGIECGCDEMLKFIGKPITVKIARQKLAILKKAGIEVRGYFMIGVPKETKSTIETTIKFALELPLYAAQITIYEASKGSPFETVNHLYGTVFVNQPV